MSKSNWRDHWSLDPDITFLNHGSFGACPKQVMEQQQQLRAQLEQEPVRFFELALEPLLETARLELGAFVGADPAQLAFVPNATTGVNTVLRSLKFQPGDELLTTNHEYNASRNALEFAAAASGAKVTVAEVPFPVQSDAEITTAVLYRVSAKTRLVLIDHVTSQTALIFPLQALIQQLALQNIDVLVDGAHAPGMISLNLNELGAAYYTGNCHKWLCAPKGAAFLYVRPDRQAQIRPLVISHGANSPRTDRSRFHLEFDWVGTADPSPYLCIPAAIQVVAATLPGGWPAVMARNRALVLAMRGLLYQQLQVEPPCPDALIGSMAVIPYRDQNAAQLQAKLFEQQIVVPVILWQDQWLIRISAHLHNQPLDYGILADALRQIAGR
ncbi:MAG: aminotransferase class V-fold PLP-dependent enzyme [Pegethrix bostrychoides GSE-TBD4-15B]|jgi:isopenicillin-N epimerase|uniref:Aminotransferase class V-fold PLP-dependent enzyme n=1 Tax=Pegethrix bostrychoides GSE-TBD4-15B TaxID=2839662 RepID=A0A951U3Q1_9CYAN|nr:aminotransferase class V-fold PLP-dependent enzyme [Pegethrix bostrychoides GSE-TBD4-15B]